MEVEKTLILSPLQSKQKLDRIAHEIQENFYDNGTLYVVGIADRGYLVAEIITNVLKEICDFDIELVKLTLDKDEPLSSQPELGVDLSVLKNKSVVLVDDVLNSGRTLVYALAHLLKSELRLVKTVTLVDRMHRRYPIRADYVGLTLSTTLQEHIAVEFKDSEISVFLK